MGGLDDGVCVPLDPELARCDNNSSNLRGEDDRLKDLPKLATEINFENFLR